MSTSNLKYSLVELGLTDESVIDFQVQELEDLLGVVGSLDERGVVDWTHFERLKVVSCQGPSVRNTVRRPNSTVGRRWCGRRVGDHEVIYRLVLDAAATHGAAPAQLRVCLHESGWS